MMTFTLVCLEQIDYCSALVIRIPLYDENEHIEAAIGKALDECHIIPTDYHT